MQWIEQQGPSKFLDITSDPSCLPVDPRYGGVSEGGVAGLAAPSSVGGKGTNGRPAARQRAAADGHTSCVAVGLLGATMPGDHCMFCQSQQLTL